jgi:hypothetical protein
MFNKILFAVGVVLSLSTQLSAAILYESGTLGPTGILQGSVAATNVNQSVYPGVRFHLSQPVITSQIGGHFVSASGGTFFGAIVELESDTDFPDSSDLSTADVLGTTSLAFPATSAEVFGDLEVRLNPGWYALVFGSGRFGTSGDGAAPRNNPDIGTPSYIGHEPNVQWVNLDIFQTSFVDHRFVVTGIIVPEPSSILISLGLAIVLLRRTNQVTSRVAQCW